MKFGEMLLAEYDREMANTRKMLAQVPQEKFDWRPHQKSWTMGQLSTHIANLPHWAIFTIERDEFDMAPVNGNDEAVPPAKTVAEVLERFDKNILAARKTIATAENSTYLEFWTLLKGGNKVMSQPKIAVIRGFVMNHIIHHRAQLGVYLRLNDVAVPSVYGPTADGKQ